SEQHIRHPDGQRQPGQHDDHDTTDEQRPPATFHAGQPSRTPPAAADPLVAGDTRAIPTTMIGPGDDTDDHDRVPDRPAGTGDSVSDVPFGFGLPGMPDQPGDPQQMAQFLAQIQHMLATPASAPVNWDLARQTPACQLTP